MAILEPLKIVEKGIDTNLYRICHLVVQRARELQGGVPNLIPTDYKKPTSQALEEMLDGKLSSYTEEEWAKVDAQRVAGQIPPPYERVEMEGGSTPSVDDLGGFTGFLNAVKRAEPKMVGGGVAVEEVEEVVEKDEVVRVVKEDLAVVVKDSYDEDDEDDDEDEDDEESDDDLDDDGEDDE
ncbi:MAG: hypothetical protein COW73_06935 [Nitrospirae bacterium CG18_big_fil_WC_8_21_14_2_50_70_55]|nr:DNA-directed RNA polymerase subunit omega [Deltaproteobacteria bacterium]OIP67194.1 MAG: hypothetical protein AUK30_01005 [Nitrospirae bacterium CG2_30_70_394]PIQ04868.1 MAG: hypothetical protein COW73_06935 [Nitrospirae bacterium CG18_big_fil_WC_8_21_14_2_50_70_55]PIU78113.1 MAG: hypothetical protein COS73_08205 [Nitrospirae bacterium CG06_land_8_20_14_3_00_70_43]PIW82149.1 MAG: hypothetical protein COZ96_10110 [Nitrospirae bacterium CG_4_8_14_3_um_filter_70_85]PIX83432.1 MAG: hypothetical